MLMRRLVFAICLLAALPLSAAIPSSERDALIAFYRSTNGDNWTRKDNWNGAPGTECSWFAVTCDQAQTTVTALRPGTNGMSGTLPPEIGNLPNLTILEIFANQIGGPIPPEMANLKKLQTLRIFTNRLTGEIPTFLKTLPLVNLELNINQLTGEFPQWLPDVKTLVTIDLGRNNLRGVVPDLSGLPALRQLRLGIEAPKETLDASVIYQNLPKYKNLTSLALRGAGLKGPFPSAVLDMSGLTLLDLSYNQLEGSIPAGIANLPLTSLSLASNNLSGDIPREIFAMNRLASLFLSINRFTGTLPPLNGLTNVNIFSVERNRLTGTFPKELPPRMSEFRIGYNFMTGELPAEIGSISTLRTLYISSNDFTALPPISALANLDNLDADFNRFSGPLPKELGTLTRLKRLRLQGNAFRGEVPREITNLVSLTPGQSSVAANALVTHDATVRAFLSQKTTPNWELAQTFAPESVSLTNVTGRGATIAWTHSDPSGVGNYQVLLSTTQGGPYLPFLSTPYRFSRVAFLSGLQPSTRYYAVVRTLMPPSGAQRNTLISDNSPELSFTTTGEVPAAPQLILRTVPSPMRQAPQSGGAQTDFTLINVGGTAADITLTSNGDFFLQVPSSFRLEAGETQTVLVTALPKPEGTYTGTSLGKIGNLTAISVPLQLISAPPPVGAPNLSVSTRRIDLVSQGTATSGSFDVTNNGSSAFIGAASSDVEWITPEPVLVRIDPGKTTTVNFTVDPAKRPDPSLLIGTVTGSISIINTPSASINSRRQVANDSKGSAANVNVRLTTVVAPGAAPLPPLAANEIAYFIPGAGHVTGSVGLFLSDLSIANAYGTKAIDDVKLFFKAPSSSTPLTAALGSINAGDSVFIADVVNNVFTANASVGSLQIRSKSVNDLAINANVLNVSNKAGTYGTAIPVFRSDRSADAAEKIFLSGLQRTATSHTNLFIQETSGNDGGVTIDFFDSDGNVVATRTESVSAFELKQFNNVVPAGSTLARITVAPGRAKFAAYATPIDDLSGDNWVVADEAKQRDYDPSDPVVITLAGSSPGANNTYFRTDVAISNIECVTEQQRTDGDCGTTDVLMTYRTLSGDTIERTITLAPFRTAIIGDVVSSMFGASSTVGHITIKPFRGNIAVTSRTYTTLSTSAATFGTAVPVVAVGGALRAGQLRNFASIDDASTTQILEQSPGTYRNNVSLVEVLGEPATVSLTLIYLESRGKAAANVKAEREFELAPRQAILIPLVTSIFGGSRDALPELRNLRLLVQVKSATGGVISSISGVDNGTGDAILRVD